MTTEKPLSPKMLAELIYICGGGTPAAVKSATLSGLRARGFVDGRGHATPAGRAYASAHQEPR
jgi:hypothetical protein